jgi:hypothetical protein
MTTSYHDRLELFRNHQPFVGEDMIHTTNGLFVPRKLAEQ